ncbi:hypothetical protein XENTR_v10007138 [Xenopus tropicalis]|nr:hypothetical protein XENTR_v10007138 [Xenopus tropicalis]
MHLVRQQRSTEQGSYCEIFHLKWLAARLTLGLTGALSVSLYKYVPSVAHKARLTIRLVPRLFLAGVVCWYLINV